jgi:hypothetical protein
MRIVIWLAMSAFLAVVVAAMTELDIGGRHAPLWVGLATMAIIIGVVVRGLERVPAYIPTWRARPGTAAAGLTQVDWTGLSLMQIAGPAFLPTTTWWPVLFASLAWIASYLVRPPVPTSAGSRSYI